MCVSFTEDRGKLVPFIDRCTLLQDEMALMKRADTVFVLDGFEDAESSSSEEPDPKATGDPLIQNRVVQRGVLKTKLEPELWTKRFAFRLYLMVISLVNVQIMALRADFGCGLGECRYSPLESGLTPVFFVVDMAVRIIEAKPKRFFKGDESKAPCAPCAALGC
eukprot:Skav221078  [mRNA]  locus=scaffold3118:466151:474040:- [translate_table: standard]